jgi:micrococcal nuclease
MKFNSKIIYFCISFLFLAFQIINAQKYDSSLIIGEYRISKVIDGDTFRFEGLDGSARLLCIDTEENFKGSDAYQKTSEISKSWDEYYQSVKDTNCMPIKSQSPFGYDAWQWAKEFTEDVDYVRLEKDDNLRTVGTYGRYLAYAIVYKDGKEINYNIECVRQGYSPYFNKYGNSRRFHEEFVEAQNYARENKLGVWNPDEKCYPDYKERLVWWDERARQLKHYEENYSGIDTHFNLTIDGEYQRLADYVGEAVVVFGSIRDVLSKKFPYLLRIPCAKRKNFDIVVFEEKIYLIDELNINELKHYNIYVKGIIEEFNTGYQIVLENTDQIWME